MTTAMLDPTVIVEELSHGRSRRRLVVEVLLFCGLVVAVAGRDVPTLGWLAVLYLLLVPGDQLRRTLGVEVTGFGRRIILAAGGSIAVLIADCIAIQAIGLVVGSPQPLLGTPAILGVLLVNFALVCVAQRDGAAAHGPALPAAQPWTLLVALLPPIATILGSAMVDNGRGPWLLIAGFGVASGLLLVGTLTRRPTSDATTMAALFSVSLSVLWSFTLRTPYLYGYDINQEYASLVTTNVAGLWQPEPGSAYNAMLSLTAVPAVLSQATGVSGIGLFKIVYPIVFALLPVAAYLIARRIVSRGPAVVAVLVLCLNPAGFWQIGGVARQELALCCFAALMLVLVDGSTRPRARTAFALVLGLACVFTHYSTSYIAVAVLLPAAVLERVLQFRRGPTPERINARIGLLVPVVMLLAAVGWNVGVNQAAQNLGHTTASVADSGGGLSDQGSVVSTWLSGNVATDISPTQLFALSRHEAADRPWLQPYSASVQSEFGATPARAADLSAALPGLRAVSDRAFTGLRQAALAAILIGTIMLLVKRRSIAASALPELVLVAVGVAAVVRCSAALSLAYNSERLATQLSLVLVVPLALVIQWLVVRRSLLARVVATGAVATAALLATVDATGVRGVVFGSSAGNLQNSGEHVERYRITTTDVAAADWLAGAADATNQVYADRYGVLLFRSRPGFDQGLFDKLTPPLLDQRGFVFGTSENVVGGRARAQIAGRSSLYVFPTAFFDKLKNRVYSNGSAAVWN